MKAKPKEDGRRTEGGRKEDENQTKGRRKEDGRMTKTKPKGDEKKTEGGREPSRRRTEGGRTSALGTERLRHTSPKTTRLFSTVGMFGANARFSACLFNTLITNALQKNQSIPHSAFRITPCH